MRTRRCPHNLFKLMEELHDNFAFALCQQCFCLLGLSMIASVSLGHNLCSVSFCRVPVEEVPIKVDCGVIV